MAKAYTKELGDRFVFSAYDAQIPNDKTVSVVNFRGINRAFVLAYKQLRYAKRESITHILCREGRLFLYLTLFRPFVYPRVKLVLEEHSFPSRVGFVYRYMMHQADGVIAMTNIIKKSVATIVLKEKIYVASHGVDVSVFNSTLSKKEAREQLGLPQKSIIWGYTGSLTTMGKVKKGVDEILRALGAYLAKGGNALFISVGGGDEDRCVYMNLAKELDIADHVQMLGPVSQEKLAVYQRACDLLLMPFPRNEYYYMLPLKTFEYMASGRPIIASDLPSIRDILNEKNAFIISPDSPDAIMDAAVTILNDKQSAESLAKQAYADVRNYTWNSRAEHIAKFIFSL
jgi:glycosyltransferase involved in cell wall biosynthesis